MGRTMVKRSLKLCLAFAIWWLAAFGALALMQELGVSKLAGIPVVMVLFFLSAPREVWLA